MRKSTSDIWAGIGFSAVAIAFGLQYDQLEGVSRIFPELLTSFITLGGVYYVAKGIWRRRREAAPKEVEYVAWKRILLISIAALIYAALLPVLGFFVTTAIFLLLSYLMLADRNLSWMNIVGRGLAFSGLFSLSIWLGFVKLLNVPTPTGLFF